MTYRIKPLLLIGLVFFAGCQREAKLAESNPQQEAKTGSARLVDQVVEASCGQCQFGMAGSGCDLAIRVDGKARYVDGRSIDDFGDAHSDDGMCNCIRRARVTGEVRNGRFIATSFELLPNGETEGEGNSG